MEPTHRMYETEEYFRYNIKLLKECMESKNALMGIQVLKSLEKCFDSYKDAMINGDPKPANLGDCFID